MKIYNIYFTFKQVPHDLISEHEEFMIRFHSDDSMGKKGFTLTYVAVDPLDDLEEIIDEESSEDSTPFPGYISGGSSLKIPKRREDVDEDEDEDEDEFYVKKKEEDDLDEDLVTDNEENFVYNSNRIGKQNAAHINKFKKKDDEEDEIDD